MRREEFIHAVQTVRKAIRDARIPHIVRVPGRDTSPEGIKAILESYSTFMTSYSRFQAPEKKVFEAFGLTPLIDPAYWQRLIIGSKDEPSRVPTSATLRLGTVLLDEYVPRVVELLRQDTPLAPIVVRDGAKRGSKESTAATEALKFLIRESASPSLSVEQFAHILGAIQSLYDVILKVNKLGHAELVVGALDSGSDKSLDVIGVATAVSKLKELLLESWDRLRFAHASKVSVSIKTAGDGLSLLTQLSAAVKAGTISAAEGEKLRRTVLKSIDELFNSGVYTTDMEIAIPVKPSELPAERRKLIEHRRGHPIQIRRGNMATATQRMIN
jgi:hypothetical protein